MNEIMLAKPALPLTITVLASVLRVRSVPLHAGMEAFLQRLRTGLGTFKPDFVAGPAGQGLLIAFVVDDVDAAAEISDRLAPEHLELHVAARLRAALGRVDRAGAGLARAADGTAAPAGAATPLASALAARAARRSARPWPGRARPPHPARPYAGLGPRAAPGVPTPGAGAPGAVPPFRS